MTGAQLHALGIQSLRISTDSGESTEPLHLRLCKYRPYLRASLVYACVSML